MWSFRKGSVYEAVSKIPEIYPKGSLSHTSTFMGPQASPFLPTCIKQEPVSEATSHPD